MKNFASIFILIVISYNLNAQADFDKDFYLVDSLDALTFTPKEKTFLDSVLTQYHTAKNDIDKLRVLGVQTNENTSEPVLMLYSLYKEALITKKLETKPSTYLKQKYLFFLKNALFEIGVIHLKKSEYLIARDYFQKVLNISKSIDDKEGESHSLIALGAIFHHQRNTEEAITYILSGLKIAEKINDLSLVSESFNLMGNIYLVQEDLEKAYDFFLKALKISKKMKNKSQMAYNLINVGAIYEKKGDLDSALYYYEKALEYESILIKSTKLITLNNIGSIYVLQSNYSKSLEYLLKALELAQETKNKKLTSRIMSNIGALYSKQGQLEKAKSIGIKAFKIAQEIKLPEQIKWATDLLYKVYKKEGDNENALRYYELYISMRDSITNEETKTLILKKDFEYQTEKKEQQIKILEKDKKILEKDKKIAKSKKRFIYTISIALLLILILIIIILIKNHRSRHKLEAQKQLRLKAELKQRVLKEKQFKIEIELKGKQLMTKALDLTERNELLTKLLNNIETLNQPKEEDYRKLVNSLTRTIRFSLKDNSQLDEFKTYFEEVEKDFIDSIQKNGIQFNEKEIRFLSLIKIGLSIKEVAHLMHVTPDSVKKSRYRLKKKLNLSKEKTLEDFIRQH